MIRKNRPFALALTLLLAAPLLLAGACSDGEGEAAGRHVDLENPSELGAFAARVEREPARAEEILSSAGVSREEFQQAILAVAQDPEAALEYRDAFLAELGDEGPGQA